VACDEYLIPVIYKKILSEYKFILKITLICRTSMDSQISRMLHLHLTNRYPAGYPDLEISMTVQTSAMIGLGLLYQESGSRPMMEMLLNEIVRFSGGVRVFPKSTQSHQQVGNSTASVVLICFIIYFCTTIPI
jgi:hypothetical protein